MLQDAINLDPKDWRWPNQLGVFYLFYTSPLRLDDAIAQFNRAITLTPDNGRIYSNLGVAYSTSERFTEARVAFESAIRLDSSNAACHSNLGAVYRIEGEYSKAAESFQRAMELAPRSYLPVASLASALEWLPNSRQEAHKTYLAAISLAEVARKEQPKDTRILATLGLAYATVGNAATTEERAKHALALDGSNAQILFRACETYELLRRRDEALKYLSAAIRAGY